MNALSNLSANLIANVVTDHQLITLTKKQEKQIAIIREAASIGDLSDVLTSKDKIMARMVLSLVATNRMNELIETYMATGNPSTLVRWINIQIGAMPIPLASAKKIELANYEAAISFWVSFNTKGEPNTEKTKQNRSNAVAWLAPVFKAIADMNTVTEEKTESLQG